MRRKRHIPFLAGIAAVLLSSVLSARSSELDLWVMYPLLFFAFLALLYHLPLDTGFIFRRFIAAGLILFSIDPALGYLETLIVEQQSRFVYNFISTVIWPNVLPFFIAPAMACWFFTASKKWRPWVLSLAVLLYLLNNTWFVAVTEHYRGFGTPSNTVSEPLPVNWSADCLSGAKLRSEDFRNRVVLLDFWNSGCGACIAAFPVLDSFFTLYRSNERCLIQSVFVPYREGDSPALTLRILSNNAVSFPVVYGAGLDSIFLIKAYPTVLVIHDTRIVYRGRLEGAMKVFDRLVRSSEKK